jgi:tRNA-binding protein
MKKEITFEDFSKVDFRVGTIITVEYFPQAKKPAYKLAIDFGALGVKNSSAQITDSYTKEDLINKKIVAIINFKKKQIANFFSECLVLGIANSKNEIVLLQTTSNKIKNGEQVS